MARKKNVVAIIPARYGSTRVPAKPLIGLCGKSLIQRVYEQTKKAALVNRVIVATDHNKIVEEVKRFDGEVVMTPTNIKSGSDRIAYVAKKLSETDIIVNVQGDEPLIEPRMIDEAIKPLIKDPARIYTATVVKQIESVEDISNPNVVKAILDKDGFAIYFSRSPIPYLRDITDEDQWYLKHKYYKHFGLYVFRKDFLLQFSSWKESSLERAEKLEQLRIIENGYKIKAIITKYDSISVDTFEDVKRIKKILQKTKVKRT